jgi:hypothetical protein
MAIYDVHPVYPHQATMPYAHEPWKTLYVWQRLLTTVLLVPLWALAYLCGHRPRRSWALKQLVIVYFYRRVYRVVEVAGVTWGTRRPDEAPAPRSLKETRFEWVPPLREELRTGVVVDADVPCVRVGAYRWPKAPPPDAEPRAGAVPVIGVFLHGGGYTQMSAHEGAGTSRIPRRLVRDGTFSEIYGGCPTA